jgi:hypothetical protein
MRARIPSIIRYLVAVTLVLGACGPPSGQRATRTPASPEVTDDEDRICRDEAPTGTILTRPVCRSRAQSDEDRQRAVEFMMRPKAVAAPRR